MWHWPQLVMLGLWIYNITYTAVNHGKPKVERDGQPHKHNAWTALTGTAIGIWLLYMGGWWS